MKVLLIYPFIESYILDPPKPCPPLGLAYIAAVLEKNGYEVKILDCLALGMDNVQIKNDILRVGLSIKDIKEHIEKFKPDLVGVSAGVSAHYNCSIECAKLVKEFNPDCPIIFGGSHSTADAEHVIKESVVDAVVLGEGEFTFLDIANQVNKKELISNIPGAVTKTKEGDVIKSKPRPFIEDIDTLPLPARHLLPMEIYAQKYKLARDQFMRYPRHTMLTSRGCPGSCIFCSIHSIWGHKWRPRSPEKVIDEIKLLVYKYGAREIAFYDDSISVKKYRLMKICDFIIQENLDIKWDLPNGIAIWTLDKEVIKKMKDAGLYRLTLGIESGCKKTQGYIGKSIDLEKCNSLIKYANKIGLWTQSTFIIGFPNEDLDSINETINFAIKSDLDFARFYIATPFPGTRLTESFQKEGLLPGKPDYASVNFGSCNTRFFTAKELQLMQSKAYRRFMISRIRKFLNPIRIIKKIKSFEDIKYLIKIMGIVSSILFSGSKKFTKKLYGGHLKKRLKSVNKK